MLSLASQSLAKIITTNKLLNFAFEAIVIKSSFVVNLSSTQH